jgi:hypothetical protein
MRRRFTEERIKKPLRAAPNAACSGLIFTACIALHAVKLGF